MEFKVFLAMVCVGVICSVTAAAAAEDCNTGVSNLLPHVRKDNVTQPDCDEAREQVQQLLDTCESNDGVEFVMIMFDFVKTFGKGEGCHDTPGPFPKCHEVPSCYKSIISPTDSGELKYSCGDNNENADAALECLQTQIDNGCEKIGKKVKSYNQEAADKFCYSGSSQVTASFIAVIVMLFINFQL